MKKLIIYLLCFLALFTLPLFIFSACRPTITDDAGIERDIYYGYFAQISCRDEGYTMIVYDTTTKVVYYLQRSGYNGFLSPYLIYQDGQLYGAIFEDGKIIPVPYASTPLE